MWEEIFNLALNNGLWAVLFLGLLIYQLKDSRVREQKYQNTINELSKTLNKVNEIDENVVNLSKNIVEVGKNIKQIESNVSELTKKHKKTEEVNEQTKNNGVLD